MNEKGTDILSEIVSEIEIFKMQNGTLPRLIRVNKDLYSSLKPEVEIVNGIMNIEDIEVQNITEETLTRWTMI